MEESLDRQPFIGSGLIEIREVLGEVERQLEHVAVTVVLVVRVYVGLELLAICEDLLAALPKSSMNLLAFGVFDVYPEMVLPMSPVGQFLESPD